MPHRSNLTIDVAERAESALGSAMEEIVDSDDQSVASVEEPMRSKTRVLFVTTDVSLLEPESKSLEYYSNLSTEFDEVHIMVLRQGRIPHHGVLRAADNLWLYVAAAKYWWWLPVTAKKVIENELVFAGGFRPDVVVARDPFECGLVAYYLANRFSVPIQLHVLQNIFARTFRLTKNGGWVKRRVACFLLQRVKSVRTATVKFSDELRSRFPNLFDVSVWPQFHDYRSIAATKPSFDVHEKYPEFSFVMVYLGNLTYQSTLPKLLEDLQEILRNPRVGLLVIGTGSAKNEFQKKAKGLGIETQVVFVPAVTDPISYLKTASLVFVTDVSEDGDASVLDAAASGTAIIMTLTEFREDIFEDGVSAMICDPGDTACIKNNFLELLNKVEKRKKMGEEAKQVVIERIHEDRNLFIKSIRDSIESAFVLEHTNETTDHNPSR